MEAKRKSYYQKKNKIKLEEKIDLRVERELFEAIKRRSELGNCSMSQVCRTVLNNVILHTQE